MKGANARGVGANDVFTALVLPAGSVGIFLDVVKPVGTNVSFEPTPTTLLRTLRLDGCVRKRLCHDLLLIFVDNVAHPLGADYFNRITVFLQQTDKFIRTPDSF